MSLLIHDNYYVMYTVCILPLSTAICTGDSERFPIASTNNQLSYEIPVPATSPTYQQTQAYIKTHRSNFHPGDTRIHHFNQTCTSPKGVPLNWFPPAGNPPVINADMNVSHFPQGDLDGGRVTTRMNFSSMQNYHRPVSSLLSGCHGYCVLIMYIFSVASPRVLPQAHSGSPDKSRITL